MLLILQTTMNEEYEDEENSSYSQPQYFPSSQRGEQNAEFSKDILYFNQEIDSIERDLRGQMFVTVEEIFKTRRGEVKIRLVKKLKQVGKPIMNEAGICRTLSVIRGVVNKNTTFNNIDRQEAYTQGLFEMQSFLKMMFKKNSEYELSSADLGWLNTRVGTFIFMVFHRAVAGGEREALSRNNNTSTLVHEMRAPKVSSAASIPIVGRFFK